MRTLATTTLLFLAAALPSQSPLVTTYAANGGGAPGGQVLFDLTVHTAVTLTRLDVHVGDPVGTSGTIEVWLTPVTHVGATASPGLWALAGSGSVTARGVGEASPLALPAGVVLTPASYGVALRYVGLSFLRTSGSSTYATAEMTLVTGGVQNTPWGAFFTPRQWNGALHYRLGSVAGPFGLAVATEFGAGCGGLALGASGAPTLGGAVVLQAAGVAGTASIGAVVYGLTSYVPGNSLAALGAPSCFEHVAAQAVRLIPSPVAGLQDTLTIPTGIGFLGLAVFAQSAVFDPGLAAGLATSNGIELLIGNT